MNTFQIIGLVLVGMLIALSAWGIVRGRTTRGAGVVWILLWVATGVALAQPGVTQVVAGLLGIGRGADLVFYVAILGALVGFFAAYLRMRRFEVFQYISYETSSRRALSTRRNVTYHSIHSISGSFSLPKVDDGRYCPP